MILCRPLTSGWFVVENTNVLFMCVVSCIKTHVTIVFSTSLGWFSQCHTTTKQPLFIFLCCVVLEGIMEGLRHQGRPRRQWIHDIEEWTGCEYIQLKETSQDRAQWRRKISEWSSAVANPNNNNNNNNNGFV